MKKFVQYLFFSLLVLFQGVFSPLQAQNYQRHFWYFGNSPEAIQFNMSDNEAQLLSDQNNSLGYGVGGPLTVTDNLSGELNFYTDGNNVFTRQHELMTNGSGLTGDPNLNQAVVGCPVPDEDGQYYIFTQSGGDVYYHMVDMTLQGAAPADAPPLGAVAQQNQSTGISGVNEAMFVIQTGTDDYDYWLLVQNSASEEFEIYSIESGGTFTQTSTFSSPVAITAANFAFHAPTNTLAVSPSNVATNVQLFTFDSASVTFTYDRGVLNTGFNDGGSQSVYDVEFSLSGDIMYVSRFGGTAKTGALYRIDLTQATPSPDRVNQDSLYRSFGVQMGPDSAIYHLFQSNSGDPIQLARINEPDSAMALIDYELNPFGSIDFDGQQFPSFAPRVLPELGCAFEWTGSCLSNPTEFIPTWTDQPDLFSYEWDFGDTTSNNHSPIYTFAEAGFYDVALTVSYNGVDTTCSVSVEIVDSDSVDLGQDTTICPGEVLTLDAGEGGLSYTWNEQDETGQTMSVDSAGTYWVVVDYGTCQSYDAINVEVYGEEAQFANVWYFGDQAGIDFNEQPPVALTDGQTQAPAGVATMSDANGDLLFYTDGDAVYDRTHTEIETGIGGENGATQSSLIVEVPDDPTLYYIFTTEDIYNTAHEYVLRYSIFDLKISPNGGIVPESKAAPLFYKSTERVAAVGGDAGSWVLAHELGTNTFRAYEVTSSGISQPVLSSIGSVHSEIPQENGEGYMKFSSDGSRVAVALSGNSNYVEIFDFDNSTGELSNPLQIEFPDAYPSYTVYGLEFTSEGEKLYVTLKPGSGGESVLYEVNLYEYEKSFIETNLPAWEVARVSGAEFGALQTGSDGQVYMAINGESFLGTFSPETDSATLASYDYDNDRFDLETGVSHLGLPNFVQNINQQTGGPGLSYSGVCLGSTTVYVGTPTSIIDEISWTFGDGASDNGENVEHTYGTIGTYTVNMNVTNRCGLDTTLTEDVTIVEPIQPTLAAVTPICTIPLTLDADTTNTQPATYLWSTTETTKLIDVDAPQTVWVEISTPEGCVTQDTTIVIDGRPQFDLGENMVVCQDESVDDLNTGLVASASGYGHTWYINDILQSNTSRLQAVDTSVPGVFMYKVEVTDNLTGCIAEDSIQITVNATPTATTSVTQSNCGNSDGEIDITNISAGISYEWFDNSGTSQGTSDPLSGISSGVYQLQLTDDVTGCTNTQNISVTDLTVSYTLSTQVIENDCDLDTIQFTVQPVTIGDLIEYDLVNNDDNSVVSGSESATTTTHAIDITELVPANYTLTVSVGGCTDNVASIDIQEKTNVDLTVEPVYDYCESDNAEISATSTTSGASFSWTGPSGFTGSGSTVTATETGYYVVTASAANFCDIKDSTEVTIYSTPTVGINTASDGCDGTRDLEAVPNPDGNYSYIWNTGGTGPSITINQSGTYDVTVANQQSGCQATASIDAEVYDDYFVSVSVDPIPCDDGAPVTITADAYDYDGNQLSTAEFTYSWYQNDALLEGQTSSTLSSASEGTYRAVVQTASCAAEGEVNFERAPLTESNIDPEYVFCPEEPVSDVITIDVSAFQSYTATNLDDGSVVSTAEDGIYALTEEGNYAFELVNIYGCTTYDTTYLEEKCLPTIVVPNVFRPSSALSVNQTFKILPLYIEESSFEIFIYNRWGEIIFYSNNIDLMENEGWDGTMDGKLLPSGTYAYIMKYKSSTEPSAGTREQSGAVTLLR